MVTSEIDLGPNLGTSVWAAFSVVSGKQETPEKCLLTEKMFLKRRRDGRVIMASKRSTRDVPRKPTREGLGTKAAKNTYVSYTSVKASDK